MQSDTFELKPQVDSFELKPRVDSIPKAITLDPDSQRDLERLEFSSRGTDVIIVNSQAFKRQFSEILTDDPNIKIYYDPYFGVEDKIGKRYLRVTVSSEQQPQIIRSEAAYPCSLVIAYDDKGNAGIVHISQLLICSENEEERNTAKASSVEAFGELSTFIRTNLNEEAKLIISATNIGRKFRDRVITSIKDDLNGAIDELQIFQLFVDEGNKSKYTSTDKLTEIDEETISSIYFVPKQFTKDIRNKIFFISTKWPENQETVEAREWRKSLADIFSSRRKL
jgi:hypothetical protein